MKIAGATTGQGVHASDLPGDLPDCYDLLLLHGRDEVDSQRSCDVALSALLVLARLEYDNGQEAAALCHYRGLFTFSS
jgi:hypothetical protein